MISSSCILIIYFEIFPGNWDWLPKESERCYKHLIISFERYYKNLTTHVPCAGTCILSSSHKIFDNTKQN